jgi:hypothetical protein
MSQELKSLRCAVITCNRKNWYMLLDEYNALEQKPNICPRCFTKNNDGKLATYQEVNQAGEKRTQTQTLITIDSNERSTQVTIKKLNPYSSYITTIGRYDNDEQATRAIIDMEVAEPGRYYYVTLYRMQKEASAT